MELKILGLNKFLKLTKASNGIKVFAKHSYIIGYIAARDKLVKNSNLYLGTPYNKKVNVKKLNDLESQFKELIPLPKPIGANGPLAKNPQKTEANSEVVPENS
ncbi:hypothetical protein ACH5RR_013238 [Cinchona calisaya]|uniref:Uncharacterized protein n=1 Tax=Cinchona calisaya TaxID=153742 RepID=A0ABD2ZZH3_9GENT